MTVTTSPTSVIWPVLMVATFGTVWILFVGPTGIPLPVKVLAVICLAALTVIPADRPQLRAGFGWICAALFSCLFLWGIIHSLITERPHIEDQLFMLGGLFAAVELRSRYVRSSASSGDQTTCSRE